MKESLCRIMICSICTVEFSVKFLTGWKKYCAECNKKVMAEQRLDYQRRKANNLTVRGRGRPKLGESSPVLTEQGRREFKAAKAMIVSSHVRGCNGARGYACCCGD